MKNKQFQILLYYKYVAISDPDRVREDQKKLCESLGLTGRIIVAQEGINGTVEGIRESTGKYIAAMEKSKYFSGIVYKKSVGTGNAFSKISVKVRPEIVTARMPHLNPNQTTGKYISAEQLHQWFEEKKEFYIVDMRNDYEYASGYFEGSLFSGMRNFFELSDVLPRIEHLRDKTIITVCTGGIRCEKASGFLVENGFTDVYQLKDGIQTYMETYPNKHFKGKLYVFDGRITMGFNTDSPSHEIVGRCRQCSTVCDSYVNCEYDVCHKHYICCENCRDTETGLAFCNNECKENFFKSKHGKNKFPQFSDIPFAR